MLPYRKLPIFVLLLLAQSSVYAAKNIDSLRLKSHKVFSDELKISAGTFFSPGNFRYNEPNEFSFSYERKVLKNWHIGIEYCKWQRILNSESLSRTMFIWENYRPLTVADNDTHPLLFRISYKMWDGYVFYKTDLYKGKHFFNIGAGVSYCWGKNVYLKWYSPPLPGYFDSQVLYTDKFESYWGICPQVSYDYLFLKNRINVGVDIKSRYYFNWPVLQFYTNIHAGVNF